MSDEPQKTEPSDEEKEEVERQKLEIERKKEELEKEKEEIERERVTVRLTRGTWTIEITCAPERVQQAVNSVLAGMSSKEGIMLEQAKLVEPEEEKKFGTCRGLLLTMLKEGWFGEPRQLSEAHDEMARRGYHYDRTAVAHSLVDLVREGALFRDGSMRNYRYVQKFPHTKA